MGRDGFLRNFTVASDGLFKVSLGLVRVNDCPGGLEPSAGARDRRKASRKIRRKPSHHQTDQVQKLYIEDRLC